MLGVKEFLSNLNEIQKKIVFNQNVKNPILVLAGPGSGKTRVIVAKIVYLIKYLGIEPEEILALTFTNKAAEEMNARVRHILNFDKKLHIHTFHSFGAWLLRLHYKDYKQSFSSNFTIWDTDDVMKFVKQLELAGDSELIKYVTNSILKIKDNFFNRHDLEDLQGFSLEFETYEAEKEKHNALDFSDLIIKPTLMLNEDPLIKSKIQRRFKVILVDEYQDTNYTQFLFLNELYYESLSLMVVGDEDQSIYSFRGARIKNILKFEENFKNVQKFYLMHNYRSTGNIIKVANSVISKNLGRYEKKMTTTNPIGLKMKLYVFQNATEEAQYVSNVLLENSMDTAILYRFNYQSFQFERAFLKKNVPHKVLGSIRFYEREEVKDIISLLRLFVNTKDRVAYVRMINKPSKGIGKKAIARIISLLNLEEINFDLIKASKYVLFELKGKAKLSIEEFLNNYNVLLERLSTNVYLNLSKFIDDVVSTFGLWEYYLKFDKEEKLRNMDELVGSGTEYKGNFEGLVIFLENSSLSPLLHGEADAQILLSSIHGVKGLEFDRVIVSGVEKGLIPAEIETLTPEKLEEERRLFYVALTRAKKELILTFNLQRQFRGSTYNSVPSVFLIDLEKDYYETSFFPEYLKENIKYFYERMLGEKQINNDSVLKEFNKSNFNIGESIFYNNTMGFILEKWESNGKIFVKLGFKNGKKITVELQQVKRITKL